MASTRLIFLVAALTVLEAIGDECTHENWEFCFFIENGHEMNEYYITLMVGPLDGKGKAALTLADKRVVAVLNATGEHLITALKEALQAELSAYVQVKADCFKLDKVDNSYNETCEKILFDVAFVSVELILAIIEVHPDSQKKAEVDRIYSRVLEYTRSGKPGFENAVHALGKDILAVI